MSIRRIAICTPVHSTVQVDFMVSLIDTMQQADVGLLVFVECSGHSNLANSRNYLVAQAREMQATDLVFIDSDIGWSPKSFERLFHYPARVVAGAPQKRDGNAFCGHPDHPVANRMGPLVSGLAATAFLRIEMSVFDELEPKVQAYIYDGVTYPAFFDWGVRNGEMVGEDIFFSRLCRENGIDVWLDPVVPLRHWTTQPRTEVMAHHITFSAPPLKEVVHG